MDDESPHDPGTKNESRSINPHLGGKDIRFLQAIQTVNERAGYEPGADDRPPATTGKIASEADLNKNEVNYRFNQRGFDTTGLGYIRVYGSEMLPNGALSAKSAELMEKGEVALQEVLDSGGPTSVDGDDDLDDRLSEVEEEITKLREENELLRETVQQFVESETGAWSLKQEEKFDATLNAMIAYQRIFSGVFNIDVGEFRDDGGVSKQTVSEARQHLREMTTTH
ncbi:hypothetical protein Halru_2804 [Halovivax ruber XH-70]|uniref:Uncharacterized protein n=1 Tax=Halovivax ruber (strain DSM 18193 / JCM 13892 / XH-70) TaxID=797302 RepID=L0ICV5_HALRX|nr:hypothetical protein [Halovivax ruber]AGB17375.1 hypothetical protein Halru_2804 [Halovivax ruber XH-70]